LSTRQTLAPRCATLNSTSRIATTSRRSRIPNAAEGRRPTDGLQPGLFTSGDWLRGARTTWTVAESVRGWLGSIDTPCAVSGGWETGPCTPKLIAAHEESPRGGQDHGRHQGERSRVRAAARARPGRHGGVPDALRDDPCRPHAPRALHAG